MNKTVLITGASQGLGYEFAKLFAKDSYDLVLVARNKEKLNILAKEFTNQYNVHVTTLVQDLADPAATQVLYAKLHKAQIVVDVLINNAGFATYGEFIKNSYEEEQDEIQVNITTLTTLTKLIIQDMVKKGNGKVLNVASTAAFLPGPYMAVYYATKAYVLSFSQALNEELQGSGVSITVLCPGPTNTGFVKRAKLENSKFFKGHVMEASVVARIGYEGLRNGKKVVIPGLRNKVGIAAITLLPRSLVMKAVKKMQSIG